MTALDPKFAKILALLRSTQHAGEQRSARARAEAVAAAAGMSFEEAVAVVDAVPVAPNIFRGFDDFMEEQEPGWKAQRAAADAVRRRENAAKRAAVISKYGSSEAALKPCEFERLILAAVAPWRKLRARPYERWTDSLDGWTGYGFDRDKMPAHVLAAITGAYPIPTTFAEAKAEHDHWRLRDEELGLILDTTGLGYGDTALDIAVGVRAEIVRDLVEKDMPVTTIEDLHTRFALYRDNENHDERIEEALFRDLSTIVEAQHLSKQQAEEVTPAGSLLHRGSEGGVSAPPSIAVEDVETSSSGSSTIQWSRIVLALTTVSRAKTLQRLCWIPTDRHGAPVAEIPEHAGVVDPTPSQSVADQIRAALDADPSRSDRAIARAADCSPTTVGKVRREMGLAGIPRSVHRRGQTFQMRFAFEEHCG